MMKRTPFPQIALGCMNYGTLIEPHIAHRMIDCFLDAGETMLDTANNYAFWHGGTEGGESEEVLGTWLSKSGRRRDVQIATKIGARPTHPGGALDDVQGLSAPVVRSAVNDSLDRIGIETIDLCYAHIDDHDVPLGETLGAFNDLVLEGKIRDIAASNYRADRLTLTLDMSLERKWATYIALQQRHSVIAPKQGYDFGVQQATTPDVLGIVRARGLRLVAYSPLLEGTFGSADRPLPIAYDTPDNRERVRHIHDLAARKSVSAGRLVLSTLIHQGVTPLIGARTEDQLHDSLAARDSALTTEEVESISVHPGKQVHS